MVQEALEAQEELAARGKQIRVVNARFVKPLDEEMLKEVAQSVKTVVTLEEGTLINGFGTMVRGSLQAHGFAGDLHTMGLEDGWVEHGERRLLLDLVKLSGSKLAEAFEELF
jgi:1-deoxy-D-xylulose-5-phosphate synthase